MRRRTFLRTGMAAAAAGALTTSTACAVGPRSGAAPALPTSDDDPGLRLASNENALGISEGARRAIRDGVSETNRYTHTLVAEFRPLLASHLGVPEETIVLGNGSTEILRMATQAMAHPGARIVVADPTFEHVEGYAEPFGIEVVKVPLAPDHAHDVGRMRQAARGVRGPVLAYVCNPNNPTGSLTPSADVEAWIEEAPEDVLFVVDEAYFEYVDHPAYRTTLPLALERPNVMVVRTFSKIYGMAGLRLGYGVARPETTRRIAAFSGKSNLNQMGLRAAFASLGDDEFLARSRRLNEEARQITVDVLDELGLERIPSHTNFVMHRVNRDVSDYRDRMREHGVRVGRPFPPMLEHNRLSFGLPNEMERFAEVLRTFRRSGWV